MWEIIVITIKIYTISWPLLAESNAVVFKQALNERIGNSNTNSAFIVIIINYYDYYY